MLALEACSSPGDAEVLFLMDKAQGKEKNPVFSQGRQYEATSNIKLRANGPSYEIIWI